MSLDDGGGTAWDPDGPRIWGLPPGADFPAQLIAGLDRRLAGTLPEAAARVTIYVNTRRMQRRLMAIWAAGPARLLPRLRLITDLAADPTVAAPPAVPALRRRLELTRLVGALLDADPSLAPRAAAYDLAESLAGLMDEMRGEGVTPAALQALDVGALSAHWARSLRFIDLVARYFGPGSPPDTEARQRLAVEATVERWVATPPADPVIVAGSTGSRGATAAFMLAVARLPQGAVVLPGYDFDLPARVWGRLGDGMAGEDHPQFRFARLLDAAGVEPGAVRPWTAGDALPPDRRSRAALVSLALRPAPVTDQWREEGARLDSITEATARLTLIEAPSPRAEAMAIALCLRRAAEDGRTAALITPDRTLSRQVTAALDRWGILPDDSAGRPLSLTAPGRFLRQVAEAMGAPMTAEPLLALLKHPLCHTGAERGAHLRLTREFELWQRKRGPAFPTARTVADWAAARSDAGAWADWLGAAMTALAPDVAAPLPVVLKRHLAIAERLAAGPSVTGAGRLWENTAGEAAAEAMADLTAEAGHAGTVGARDFTTILSGVLNGKDVRDTVASRPDVMIWGTLEARVQGADLVVLAGLNDGTWPDLPGADPWLNREMRQAAGLLLPDRRIGLSAHDFQQAIGAPEAVLTRSHRDAEAATVPSRWVNRLTNLLQGLPGEGRQALEGMRARGDAWLTMARTLDDRIVDAPRARRPSPRPPVAQRPDMLPVTSIRTLIRDPYAVYARRVLRLKALDPLRQAPDALQRGTVLHDILERYTASDALDADALMGVADAVLAETVPWPAARSLWRARIARIADRFAAEEAARRRTAAPLLLEQRGALVLPGLSFTLTAQPDRIDRDADGRLVVYDYKAGGVPTAPEVKHFDKQLPLEAMMAERGAFPGVPAAPVARIVHVGLSPLRSRALPVRDGGTDAQDPDRIMDELLALIGSYADPAQGYTARRAPRSEGDVGDYDHLARFGEWAQTDDPAGVDVGRDAPDEEGPA